MIKVDNLAKSFYTVGERAPKVALRNASTEISDGSIFGLIGSNGSGKSTLLRLLAGVYRPDAGTVTFDGAPVYENPAVKRQLFFLPDELWFLPQSDLTRMAKWYRTVYPTFNRERFESLVGMFRLDPEVKLQTLSKGVKRQAALVLALSVLPKYLFIDETFDGLDPVMRGTLKQLLYRDAMDRGMTTVIASHSLRELEDTCDRLALLHEGTILFSTDVQAMNRTACKVQLMFADPEEAQQEEYFVRAGLNVLQYERTGSVVTLILRGDAETVRGTVGALRPACMDLLPLDLEEVFICEMRERGYDVGSVAL